MAYDFYDYKPTIRVDGGIKAKSRTGAFASSWWAKQWIGVLESFDLGGRLTRGKSYARSGQVLGVEIGKGRVTAQVQGSARKPYDVAIEVAPLSAAQWDAVVARLADSATLSAKLLAGEMPADIGEVFAAAGASLFPGKKGDLKTRCSCPDSSNPCKHIAAVYYVLGEEFDRNPFLIFELRGLTRAELDARLDTGDGASSKASLPSVAPLSSDPGVFWNGAALPASFGDLAVPQVSATIIKRLGGVPFWRGQAPLYDTVAPIYKAASEQAVAKLLSGDSLPVQDSENLDS
jgi:uncharacterized Zn finger protein